MLTNITNIVSIRKNETDDWLDITELLEKFDLGNGDLVNEDSGRTLDGVMHNNVITDKEYYNLTFLPLTWTDIAKVMNKVRNRQYVYLRYPSPMVPDKLTVKKFYCQDRTGNLDRIYKKKDGKIEVMWSNLSFRLTEK